VQLEVPVVPPTFYAAGINYPEHVTWAAHMRGQEPDLPKKADVGYRAVNALVPDGHDIIVPADATEQLQYEGELVAVIGKTCRNVSEEEALDYVLGYTIGNDVSERVIQFAEMKMGAIMIGKSFDTFKPLGPIIATDIDPSNVDLTTRVNGEVRQDANTSDLLFPAAKLVSYMSEAMTLLPGDVIYSGTPAGVGQIAPGDTIDIEIQGIGTLSNSVVAED
jgi:2-keto-4-pentenoate hydratase/2-oxohepta-3-ene-1,7-dioic acid hydratase in catechol pathway